MKALVVDDSRVIRKIVSRILAPMGFEAIEAENGEAALEQLEAHGDMALCCIDWNMPVMSGLDLVVAIRKNAEWRDITLMMITAEGEQDQIVRALAAGAHEYVIKPFTPEVIFDKLQFLGLVKAKETA